LDWNKEMKKRGFFFSFFRSTVEDLWVYDENDEYTINI
jgi:hypothetical protein